MRPVVVQAVQSAPQVKRSLRSPVHSFYLRTRPWQIQPFVIAPVLPGETMKNAMWQARVVTDPIANPLIGWWCEYFLFYVKLRDLEARELLQQMVLNPATDISSLNSSAEWSTYHSAGSPNWVRMCLDRVVDEYFRDDGEAVNVATIDGIPLAAISVNGWWDSIKDATVTPSADKELPGYEEDPDPIPGFGSAYAQWQMMRDMKLTSATYEDFLRSYGVNVPSQVDRDEFKPELLRYSREWTYPTNTVEATTGVPSSACSWSIAERADKDRYFKEPGFLFGVTVARPKVYLSRLRGAGVDFMADAWSWLPALALDDPYTALRNRSSGTGPVVGSTNGYWVDVRDLLLYGDQFMNFDPTVAGNGLTARVDLPTAALAQRFADATAADRLFVSPTVNRIRQDGTVSFKVLGHFNQDETGG